MACHSIIKFRAGCTATLLLTAGLPLSAPAYGQAGDAKRATIHPADPPPTVDGVLDDACWQGEGWRGDFSVLNAPDQPAPVPTRFRWAADDSRLYLAVHAAEPRLGELRPQAQGPDAKAWEEESLELMLAPNDHGTTYYHFAFTADRGWYDAKVLEAGRSKVTLWNSATEFATGRDAEGWTLEAAIPLADLGLADGGPAGQWLFNLTRNRYLGDTPSHTSYAPVVGGFHDPSRFVPLDPSGVDVAPFRWQVHGPIEPRVAKNDDGYRFTTRLLLHNRTDRFRFVRYTVGLDDQPPMIATAGVAAGQPTAIDVDLPTTASGQQQLKLEVLDRADADVWGRWQAMVDTAYSPLTVAVSEPAYRRSFYASQGGSRVAGSIALAEPLPDGARLTLRLLGPDGAELAEESFQPAGLEQPYTLELPEATGDYRVQVRIEPPDTDRESQPAQAPASAETVIHRWPAADQEVTIDRHGVTRRNGEPMLPFGWFSVKGDAIETTGPLGVNVTMDYDNYYRTEAEQQAYLDRLHAAGMQVLSYPYPIREMNLAPAWQRPLTGEEAAAIRAYVLRWKYHPAILAWYMADEPELRPALVERADAIYEIVRDADPYHPCIMLNDTLDGIRDYYRGGDVMMPDPYPHFLVGGGSAKPMSYVTQFVEEVHRLPVDKALWLTPQAFNYADFGRANNREPNFTELRNMMYQGVVGGSTGFVWYSHYEALPYPDMIDAVHWLEDEARQLEAFILAPQDHRDPPITADHDGLRASLRRVGGAWILAAVNLSDQPTGATFTLPEDADSSWRVMSEGRQVRAEGGELVDEFAPHAVHIYYARPGVADRLTLPKP